MPGSDSLSAPHWRAEEGVPSSPLSCLYVPRSLRRGVLNGCASQGFTASMAFAVNEQARLPLVPLVAGRLSTPQTSRDATDRRFARLLSSRCQRASTGGSRRPPPLSYPAAGPLPGPDFHRLAQRGLSGRTHSGRSSPGGEARRPTSGIQYAAGRHADLFWPEGRSVPDFKPLDSGSATDASRGSSALLVMVVPRWRRCAA
jgi:hypothetical protein